MSPKLPPKEAGKNATFSQLVFLLILVPKISQKATESMPIGRRQHPKGDQGRQKSGLQGNPTVRILTVGYKKNTKKGQDGAHMVQKR